MSVGNSNTYNISIQKPKSRATHTHTQLLYRSPQPISISFSIMGRIKLPKSLLRALFPKNRSRTKRKEKPSAHYSEVGSLPSSPPSSPTRRSPAKAKEAKYDEFLELVGGNAVVAEGAPARDEGRGTGTEPRERDGLAGDKAPAPAEGSPVSVAAPLTAASTGTRSFAAGEEDAPARGEGRREDARAPEAGRVAGDDAPVAAAAAPPVAVAERAPAREMERGEAPPPRARDKAPATEASPVTVAVALEAAFESAPAAAAAPSLAVGRRGDDDDDDDDGDGQRLPRDRDSPAPTSPEEEEDDIQEEGREDDQDRGAAPTQGPPRPAPAAMVSPVAAAPKKVQFQFSARGEEAHQRAVERQRRILSQAAPRLDAIARTSLEDVGGAPWQRASRVRPAEGGDDAGPTAAAGGPQTAERVPFFVLLLCPSTRVFELLEVVAAAPGAGAAASSSSSSSSSSLPATVGDVLRDLPRRCTDARLRRWRHVGLVRPRDGAEFSDPDARPFVAADDDGPTGGFGGDDGRAVAAIRRDDLLVATLDGHSGEQMRRISRPVRRNDKFRDMLRRRSDRGPPETAGRGRGDNGGGSTCSSRRSAASSRRRRQKGRRGGGGDAQHGVPRAGSRRAAAPMVDRVPSAVPEEVVDDGAAASGPAEEGGAPPPTSALGVPHSRDGEENRAYDSLCRKLERLSRRLHDVDDELLVEEASIAGMSLPSAVVEEGADGSGVRADEVRGEVLPAPDEDATGGVGFRMTSEMVTHELAAEIKDIFAGHRVEIVAVDAADDDGDDDDDTFATARSRRSMRSARSIRSKRSARGLASGCHVLGGDDGGRAAGPLAEITTRRKARGARKGRSSQFAAFEEDDMLMQIEAMARQADVAFASHRNQPRDSGVALIESEFPQPESFGDGETTDITARASDEQMTKDSRVSDIVSGAKSVDIVPKICVAEERRTSEPKIDDVDKMTDPTGQNETRLAVSFHEEANVVTPTRALVAAASALGDGGAPCSDAVADALTVYAPRNDGQSDARLGRVLDATTSTVSTLVAAADGSVNEVHVLHYLGATIVCIAAKVMQDRERGEGRPPSSFGVRDVVQSAMFLAFMANGQRYLAKVSKRE